MIKVGDRVVILPVYSIAFGKRGGTVVEIDTSRPLPIRVKVDGKNNSYLFEGHELLTEEELDSWNKLGTVLCSECGIDITGEFAYTCEDCKFPNTVCER